MPTDIGRLDERAQAEAAAAKRVSAPSSVLRPGHYLQLTTAAVNRPSSRTQPLKHFATNEMLQTSTTALTAEDMLTPRVRLGPPDRKAADQTIADDHGPTPTRPILSRGYLSPQPAATEVGPFSTSDEFEFHPSLDELHQLSPSQLAAVTNFSISRIDGACTVKFLEPVNLAHVTIEQSILLTKAGQVVFLDDMLRRKCQVTVACIKTSRQQLVQECREKNYSFISYNEETCEWQYMANEREDATKTDDSPQQVDSASSSPPNGAVAGTAAADRSPALSNASPIPNVNTSTSVVMSGGRRAPPVERVFPQGLVATPRVTEHLAGTFAPQGQSAVYSRPPLHQQLGSGSMRVPSAAEFMDIVLPYELPPPREQHASDHEHRSTFVVPASYGAPKEDILWLPKSRSTLHAAAVKPNTGSVFASQSERFLGRSFRMAWGPGGQVALPRNAELRDGGSARVEAKEVPGASVTIADPFKAVSSTHCYIAALLTIAQWTTFHNDTGFVDLKSEGSTHLSEEKLAKLRQELQPIAANAKNDDGARAAGVQFDSFISLASALYAISDRDHPNENSSEEGTYLLQLRRRNLLSWLTAELKKEPQCLPEAAATPAKKLVSLLLRHDVSGALRIAQQDAKDNELSRALAMWGHVGNTVGPYAKLLSFSGGPQSDDAARLVGSILEGEAYPFVEQTLYNKKAGTAAAVNPSGVTWKQLLGIFAFYGCSPVASAGEIVNHFASRFVSRRERAVAPYSTGFTPAGAASLRGQDVLRHGLAVDDVNYLLLKAFAKSECVPPQALHPNSFTYHSRDFFGPFLALIVIRAIGCHRSREYRDAEYRVLVGLAAQLLSTSSWSLAALPLSLIEDGDQRKLSIEQLLSPIINNPRLSDAQHERVLVGLGVDVKRLKAASFFDPPKRQDDFTPRNMPSLTTHTKLQKALKAFASAQ